MSNCPFRPEGTDPTEDQMLVRKRVLEQIEGAPFTFDMSNWEGDACGTTRCLAGWAQYLTAGRVWGDTAGAAVEAMGLSRAEYRRGRDLFCTDKDDALARMRVLASDPF